MKNLSDIDTVRALLNRHGFSFSKSLGQNFLIDPTVCPRLSEAAGLDSKTAVIEIGAGIGVLTAELAKRAGKVIAFELDRRLLPVLGETLAELQNVEIVNEDFLKADLRALIAEKCPGMRLCVCANLPYYITSPAIMRLLEERYELDSITVMVQREAAVRLAAPVGSREGGAVTAAVRYFSEPERLFFVPRTSFFPPPHVDSEVIRLTVHKTPPIKVSDEAFFFKIVRAAFSQRRKTLCNALSGTFPKERVAAFLMERGRAADIRPERLTMEDFAALADSLGQKERPPG